MPYLNGVIGIETYIIDKYSAFKDFKKNVGNNNQYLITSIIGIEKLEEADTKNKYFAPWEPNDVKVAKDRAEIFVRKAGLTWCIDCLDVLLKDFFRSFYNEADVFIINQKDYSVSHLGRKKELSDRNTASFETIYRSVYYKFAVICELLRKEKNLASWRKASDYRVGKKGKEPYFPDLELVIHSVDLAIQWRNNLVHNGINNSINRNTAKVLKCQYGDLLNSPEYGTLEVDRMLEDFKENTITFKELAVLIRSIIDFGFILNAYWIHAVNKQDYIRNKLLHLNEKKIVESLGSLSDDRKKNYIIMYLRTHSISLRKIEAENKSIEEEVIDEFLARFSNEA